MKIMLDTSVNTDVAEKKLKRLEDQANKTAIGFGNVAEVTDVVGSSAQKNSAHLDYYSKMMARAGSANLAFNRIIQDSPYFMQNFSMGVVAISNNIPMLAEQFTRLRETTGSTKSALRAFFASFTGPQGWLAIISLAVTAFTALSIYLGRQASEAKKAKEEMDDYLKSVQNFVNVTSPLDDKQIRFQASMLKQIIAEEETAISKIRDRLKDPFSMNERIDRIKKGQSLEGLDILSSSQITKLDEEIKLREVVVSKLKEELKENEALVRVAEIYNKYLVDRKEKKDKKSGKAVEPDWVNFIKEDMDWFEKEILANEEPYSFAPLVVLPTEEELRSKYKVLDIVAKESANTLRTLFEDAWESIFGKADNLFTSLLSRISSGIFDLLSKDISSSIFELLVPEAGLFTSIFGLFKSSNAGALGGGSVLVQIGDDQVQKATTKAVTSTVSELNRRRILN